MSGSMNQYLVQYLDPKAVGFHARTVTAHRVEGWREDYAFFGHASFPGEVTKLIPRRLVLDVEMTYDANGEEPNPPPAGSMAKQARAFQEAARFWQDANPGLLSVVGSTVCLEIDGRQSRQVSREGWTADDAEVLVDRLAGDLDLTPPPSPDKDAEPLSFEDVVG